MEIYSCEKDLGLTTDPIIASSDMSIPANDEKVIEAVKKFRDKHSKDYHLKYLVPKGTMLAYGIMVSTNWNLNDDVFTPAETWAARMTPVMKPVNNMHRFKEKKAEIIGVISGANAVDDNYEGIWLDENREIPSKFHLLVGTMLWENYFPETCKAIKKAISDKKGYLSMECTADDFGYALRKEGSDEVILLPRNEITAYLTKSLRAYKGTGSVDINGETYRIGRWLRGITFTGVAYVDRPGNPESIVFEDYLSHVTASIKFSEAPKNFAVSPKDKSKKVENSVSYLQTKGNCVAWVI